MKVTYTTNNSGGGWWLSDDDWRALEAAGWVVDWVAEQTDHAWADADGRFLGALATSAYREGLSLDDAIEEWERVTGERASDEGCDCCGAPHYFFEEE